MANPNSRLEPYFAKIKRRPAEEPDPLACDICGGVDFSLGDKGGLRCSGCGSWRCEKTADLFDAFDPFRIGVKNGLLMGFGCGVVAGVFLARMI